MAAYTHIPTASTGTIFSFRRSNGEECGPISRNSPDRKSTKKRLLCHNELASEILTYLASDEVLEFLRVRETYLLENASRPVSEQVSPRHRCQVHRGRLPRVCPFGSADCAISRNHDLRMRLRTFLPRRVQVCGKDGTMLRRLILVANLWTHSKIRSRTVNPIIAHVVIDLEKGGIR